MIDPDRAEPNDEGPLEDIETDDDAPLQILEYAREYGYRPAHPRVLPPEPFSDARATPEQCGMVNAPTGPDDTGPTSETIRMRLACRLRRLEAAADERGVRRRCAPRRPTNANGRSWTAGAARLRTSRSWTRGPRTVRCRFVRVLRPVCGGTEPLSM